MSGYGDTDVNHPLHTISDFKSLAKGCLDIAHLLATVNQIRAYRTFSRHAWMQIPLMFSCLLQVASGGLLLYEKLSEPMGYTKRKRINFAIGVMMFITVLIGVIATGLH